MGYYVLISLLIVIVVVVVVIIIARAFRRSLSKMSSVADNVYMMIEQNMPATVLKKSAPSSLFQATFGFPDGTQKEFAISKDIFDSLIIGDKGILYYRGLLENQQFVRFVQN